MQNELRSALETLRVYHDVSVALLADRLGLPQKHIVAFEKGRRKITLEVVQRYAQAFEIPVSSLLLLAEQSGGVFTRDAGDYVADKVVVIIEWLTNINSIKWKELTGCKRMTEATAPCTDLRPAPASEAVPNSPPCCSKNMRLPITIV
jgi:transcriptional regulator with XRE-family HTH domain